MTSRKFKGDILVAAAEAEAGRIEHVSSVRRGDEGEVIATYITEKLPHSLHIRLVAANVDQYPGPCSFLLFTDDEDAPREVSKVLEKAHAHFATGRNFTILQAISYLSRTLDKCLSQSSNLKSPYSSDDEMPDVNDVDHKHEHGDSDYDEADDDIYDSFGANTTDEDTDEELFFAQMSGRVGAVPAGHTSTTHLSPSQLREQERIRESLCRAKSSGCKIGIQAGLLPSCDSHMFSMSVRVSKLGLSEENLQAWGLSAADYLILLVYISGAAFPSMQKIMENPAAHNSMKFRIRKCTNFKPTLAQAIKAFNEIKIRDCEFGDAGAEPGIAETPLECIFLSRSFDTFMTECFVPLVKLRESTSCSWEDANERLINGINNTADTSNSNNISGKSMASKDHMIEGLGTERSVPLICWEFAMKYFTDCTKYCLRCHRLVKNDVGSLKPFVCSNPLCLFQYMQMGLGPSVEHEILTQPKVVDLLCNFCYSSTTGSYNTAAAGASLSGNSHYSIREFPVGLSLKVPDFFKRTKPHASADNIISVRVRRLGPDLFLETYDHDDWLESLRPGVCYTLVHQRTLVNHAVVFEDAFSSKLETSYARPTGPISNADEPTGSQFIDGISARTELIVCGTVVSIDRTSGTIGASIARGTPPEIEGGALQGINWKTGSTQLFLVVYDTNFDSLAEDGKAMAIRFILDMLPPIANIRTFLKKNPNSTVRGMNQMMPPTATLLEWIVATNRSLIMCLEEEEDEICEASCGTPTQSLASLKIPEMSDYIQFRFAQGSPEKEERFRVELKRVMGSRYPTMFAWHGSSRSNWHSIIRTGLDFNNVANGRAYGNGVYFSQDLKTSMGYSHSEKSLAWPFSEFGSSNAVVLSELINIPDQFVRRSPHLVVQNIDWQQCRYLFIRKTLPSGQHSSSYSAAVGPPAILAGLTHFIDQDPTMTPREVNGRPIRIPRAAISSSGDQNLLSSGDYDSDDDDFDALKEVVEISSDEEEVAGDTEDSDVDMELLEVQPIKPANLTDFQPGTLDLASLPRLAPPQRSGGAGRQLAKEISALRKIQEATPAHELGWYIDFDGMSNMFQMIVELHSFDNTKPLGSSMVRDRVTSIVMELRFGENFPISPPFVRVIRPRFLPFQAGGGGHVTLGGAMCMELLTSTGWSPACSIEHVLILVRLALISEDPRPARLQGVGAGDYEIGEAILAYHRAARVHGWQVPLDFNQTAMGADSHSK